jgi:hypothetical protein
MNPSNADAPNDPPPDPGRETGLADRHHAQLEEPMHDEVTTSGESSVAMSKDPEPEPGRRAYGFRQTFPAAPSSVGKARHFVRLALTEIGIDAEDATLAVSEMFTVALTAAGGGDDIEVALRLRGGEIDLEVCSPQGRGELSEVQAAVMSAVADFYERREVGDDDVQLFGCLVKTQSVRRRDDGSN